MSGRDSESTFKASKERNTSLEELRRVLSAWPDQAAVFRPGIDWNVSDSATRPSLTAGDLRSVLDELDCLRKIVAQIGPDRLTAYEEDARVSKPVVASKEGFAERVCKILQEYAGTDSSDWTNGDHAILRLAYEADGQIATLKHPETKAEPAGRIGEVISQLIQYDPKNARGALEHLAAELLARDFNLLRRCYDELPNPEFIPEPEKEERVKALLQDLARIVCPPVKSVAEPSGRIPKEPQ